MDGAVGCGLPTAVQAVAKPAWALSGAKEGADRGERHSSSLGTALQPYLCTYIYICVCVWLHLCIYL